MKLAIGGDHRGHAAIKQLCEHLKSLGHEVAYVGDCGGEACDYPEPAYAVGTAVANGDSERGILICGTGIGVSIAANKIKGVRAALVHDELTAEMSRSHNDSNVLCLSADLLGQRLMEKIAGIWLETPFSGGRHARRVKKISALEEGRDPKVVEA
jgi:ribose 5-phosphate isomerase B